MLHLEIKDLENNLEGIMLRRYNGIEYDTLTMDDIVESGLYQILVTDKANNTISKEFYVYKEEYEEESNAKQIEVVSYGSEEVENATLKYRELYLVEYDRINQDIINHKEAFSAIKNTDSVYVIGISSSNNYVNLIKYNGKDLYNSITNVKANAAGVSESLIMINGKAYLMMALVDGEGASSENQEGTQQGGSTTKGNSGGGSFTWIFYVLGVIGVLGGGFLIMKLRKRVRAA
jgi:hypothetical protein